MNSPCCLNYRVIILDDDEDLLFHAQYWLTKKGFVTLGYIEPKGVYFSLEEFQPDLILIDIHLKYKDGREVSKYLKHNLQFMGQVVLFSIEDYSDYNLQTSLADGFILKTHDHYTLAKTLLTYLQQPH